MEGKDFEAFTVKVTNRLTGEITEQLVTNATEAKNLYIELSASETATKNAKKQLAAFLDNWLGQDEKFQFADGKVLRRVSRETKLWTLEGLRAAGLDEDAIATATKVDMTVAKEIVKEMVERGEIKPNAGRVLDEYAEVKASKPFVELR